MTLDTLLALIGFAFVTSVTPGPNNMMLLASGVNFGFRRTLPHMAGVAGGFVVMAFLVGLGLAGLFRSFPASLLVLKAASVVYMLWLAWKIARAGAPGAGEARPRPMSFLQAAAFQWVNPKAWAMALGALAAYLPVPSPAGSLAVAAVFGAVNLPTVAIWAAAGQGLRHALTRPAALRAFNWTMAVLLTASLWPVLQMQI